MRNIAKDAGHAINITKLMFLFEVFSSKHLKLFLNVGIEYWKANNRWDLKLSILKRLILVLLTCMYVVRALKKHFLFILLDLVYIERLFSVTGCWQAIILKEFSLYFLHLCSLGIKFAETLIILNDIKLGVSVLHFGLYTGVFSFIALLVLRNLPHRWG